MAQITKRVGKNGKVSYLIRVSDGYGVDGKQRKKAMTWTPPEGMTPKKIEKQLQIEALRFEEAVSAGASQDGSIRFQAFAEKWLEEYATKQLKIKTVDGYRRMLPRIYQGIGHIKLCDLKTGHLNTFYSNLQEEGMRQDTKSCARVDLKALLEKNSLNRVQLSEMTGLSTSTLRAAIDGKNINGDSAAKIAKAVGRPRSELFKDEARSETLDANTVRGYHRIISSILTKAVKWGYIPFNPAANAELPKMAAKEAAHLDEDDARRLLELLQDEPIKYRAAISFDLLSGLRRGELLGLRWSDVDFTNETVTIVQTSSYAKGQGIYTDTPKNKTSARPLKLSRSAFLILQEVQEWQEQQQALCGDRWKNEDGRVFTNDEGSPMHPDSLSKWFHEFTKRSGFPGVHVHSLRHTYASLMIADGTPLVVVSRRLGHAQVSTTANIYAHVIASADEKAAQVAEKFSDIVAAPKKKATA
jgi:integrase